MYNNAADFFFALFNRPQGYDIRVRDSQITAVGDRENLGAEMLKMDLVNGWWVNNIGVKVHQLRFPV